MKTYNIFYSWQSDIESNDRFIEDCLKEAIETIKADPNINAQFKIDRDTMNENGTPDIPNTVFNKISDQTDIFLSDITIINKKFWTNDNKIRLTPNPNVLLELGFAASTIGWENILCVINTAYGKPSELPFDIKFRKPLEYCLAESYNTEQEDLEREKLTSEFKATILSLNPNEKKYRLRETAKVLESNEWISIGDTSIDNQDWGELKIQHEINNIFRFEFESKTNPIDGDWTGQLYLNNDFFFSGKINYELNNKSSYGLKEFFIDEKEGYYYLYLFPINLRPGDHGREVFKREIKNS